MTAARCNALHKTVMRLRSHDVAALPPHAALLLLPREPVPASVASQNSFGTVFYTRDRIQNYQVMMDQRIASATHYTITHHAEQAVSA